MGGAQHVTEQRATTREPADGTDKELECAAQGGDEDAREDARKELELRKKARTGGDSEAVRELLVLHQKTVEKLIGSVSRRRKIPHEDVPDLVQDILVEIIIGLPKFRGDSRLSTWVYTVATGTALEYLRRRVRRSRRSSSGRQEPTDVAGVAQGGQDPFDVASSREESRLILDGLATLSRKHREILLLHYSDCLLVKEIAERLGISVVAVKLRLYRARLRLVERIDWPIPHGEQDG